MLNGSWVVLLQMCNIFNCVGICYMMDQNNIGSGLIVVELMESVSILLKQVEKNWVDYELLLCDLCQSIVVVVEIKCNYDIYYNVLVELI